MRRTPILTLLALVALATALAVPAAAGEVKQTYDFALNQWLPVDAADGPVTIHRLRLNPAEGRLTKSKVFRPHNSEYLETVIIQVEYTNEASRGWEMRVDLRWLDEQGRVIDGYSANEDLSKKKARGVSETSVSTFKYGVEQAATLEVAITFEP